MGLKDNCGVVGEKGKEKTIPPLWGPFEILACICVDLMGTKKGDHLSRDRLNGLALISLWDFQGALSSKSNSPASA